MLEAQRESYREEAFELLVELETSLLALEETPADKELIGRVFRALHTIKGSGAMFGFDDISAFTHEVETVFDLVRGEKMAVTKTLVDLTLKAGDRIRTMLEGSNEGAVADDAAAREIIDSLKALIPEAAEPAKPAPPKPASQAPSGAAAPSPSPPGDGGPRDVTYRIALKLPPAAFLSGANPLLLLNELRELGPCEVIANTEEIPDLEDIDPESCYPSWDIVLTTDRGIDAVKDVFIFVDDACELKIETVYEADSGDAEAPTPKLGEILVGRGDVSSEGLREALGDQKRIGELLVNAGLVRPSRLESALAEQEHITAARQKQSKEEQTSSIRVPAERLDSLVNLVGELVTVQARLSQTAASLLNVDLLSISEEVERLTSELRDNTMSIRMVPIGTTFAKFKRVVRDLSNELGKEIEMVTEGGETELDKTVIERLNDPLVHLIRNCIDHGIEAPAAREARGKPRQGTVRLSAVHSGANVLIRIADDGAGLDVEAIKAKAVERKLVAADAELTEKELFGLIFAPGFSTARQVTNVSGRGVGMDVVKRGIDALRGLIEVSSEKGVGTTITLKLPLTLAIIDGLLVRVGDAHYVLPLSIVEECVELTREDAARAHGRRMAYVRGEIIPYIRFRERFGIHGERPEVEQIVITESAGGKVGFVVDKVVGEHQTVLKNMGRVYRHVKIISGATILGDGGVALIVDVPKLVEGVEAQEALRG